MSSPPPSRELTFISPTSVDRLLRCPRAFSHAQDIAPRPAPQGPPAATAVVGIAIHRTLELCLKPERPTLNSAWAQACSECSEKGTDPRDRPDARRTLLRLERRFPQLLEFINAHEPTQEPLTETELISGDGLIRGTVDLIVVGKRPCLVDYKSGLVLEDGIPNEHFTRQLMLYAHLVEEQMGIDVSEAALFSLRDGMITVDVSTNARRPVVRACLEERERYNALAPGTQPATPSNSACSFCPYIGVCDEFWLAVSADRLELLSGQCVEGEVSAPAVCSASGVGTFAVQGDPSKGEIMITDVPNPLLEGMIKGQRVRVWRLHSNPTSPLTLSWKVGQSGLGGGA